MKFYMLNGYTTYISYFGGKLMILYITLNDDADYELETEKMKQILSEQKYSYQLLGNYTSREYVTIVLEITSKIYDNDPLTIQRNINDTCNTLESGTYMKYYYTIEPGYEIKIVNDKVRETLNEEGYNYRIYNSHSENGISYIGLQVADLNPFDNKQMEKLEGIINNIQGVCEITKY